MYSAIAVECVGDMYSAGMPGAFHRAPFVPRPPPTVVHGANEG